MQGLNRCRIPCDRGSFGGVKAIGIYESFNNIALADHNLPAECIAVALPYFYIRIAISFSSGNSSRKSSRSGSSRDHTVVITFAVSESILPASVKACLRNQKLGAK